MRVLAELVGPAVPIVVDGADEVWARADQSCERTAYHSWKFALSGALSFNTYFGSFPLWKWREETTLKNLSLLVSGKGQFDIQIDGWTAWGERSLVARAEVLLLGDTPRRIDLPPIEKIDKSISYLVVRLFCNDVQGEVVRLQYASPDSPANKLRLGVSITTFNRQQYLIRNLKSVTTALAHRPDIADDIEITVVDNGKNVELPSEVEGKVRLVPNANLGGAGGFARGLMMYRNEGRVSHVLFMDDDVTICPESIFRAMAFLSFAKDRKACIAGAMFEEERPSVQFELGAQWRPFEVNPFMGLQRGLHLDNWRALRESEDLDRSISYGAWWFYMFPVNVISDLPLPVFVRGDDVTFGLRGAGTSTTTLHGVGVWHQAFMYKNGPFHYFLEARNLPLVSLLATDSYKARHLLKRTMHFGLRFLFLMRYNTAEAFMAGTEEFMKGPEHWLQIDHPERLQYARQFTGESVAELGPEWDRFTLPPLETRRIGTVSSELEKKADPFLVRLKNTVRKSGRAKKWLYFVALGGHLVPKSISKLPTRTVGSEDMLPWGNFCRETVVYRWRATGEGYVVERDRQRFFKLFASLLRLCFAITMKAPSVIKEYRTAYPDLTSAEYWNKQFQKESV